MLLFLPKTYISDHPFLCKQYITFILSLQVPGQSVPITTFESDPAHGEMYLMQHYVIKFFSGTYQSVVSPGTAVYSTNKTDRHDRTEILLKVAFEHHKPKPILSSSF